MKKRCLCENHDAFKNYGGKGIRVCKRWMLFENFLADMGARPSKKHTIDRINPSKNYSPTNCRWATPLEQARNRRNTKLTEKDIVAIRVLYERQINRMVVAALFGITESMVHKIGSGDRWN